MRLRVADERLPVIMLTARDAPADQVLGPESGADDYVVKPYTFAVLLARLRALVRRHQIDHPALLTFTNLSLDTSSRQVRRGQREIVLTALEFKLLRSFLEHPQQVLAKDRLLGLVWGVDFGGSPTWWRSTSSSFAKNWKPMARRDYCTPSAAPARFCVKHQQVSIQAPLRA